MKRLFIMHTQYNLILSAAILAKKPKGENTVVVFSEFTLNDEMKNALEKVFEHVVVVRDAFYSHTSTWDEIMEIRACLKKVKFLKRVVFDEIYMSQERDFDRILVTRAKKINPKALCYHVEEDVYYSINEKYNNEDFVLKRGFRAKLRKFLYALLLLGYPYNYREVHYCYGMSELYDGAHMLFPWLARRELQGRKLLEIEKKELLLGIDSIYNEKNIDYPKSEKYALIFFDLINRYKNLECVKKIVKWFIEESQRQGRKILMKYHPRETEKIFSVDGAFEIPHVVPAEKVLYDLQNTDTVVFGNATTSCVVAAKLGFSVMSICKLESPANHKMHEVMRQMNIQCITDLSQIQKGE